MIGAFAPPGAYPWAVYPSDEPGTTTRTVYRQRTARFATHDMATLPTDTPANTNIEGRLLPFRYRSGIAIDQNTGRYCGASPIGTGAVTLANSDHALDKLIRETVTDGQRIRIKVGLMVPDAYGRMKPWPFADFGAVLEAACEQWQLNGADPVLNLRDATMNLQRPVQPFTYNGSGRNGGTAELNGVTKEICYGECRNVTPTLRDPSIQLYGVGDAPIKQIMAVRDRGVRLTPMPEPNIDDEAEFLDADCAPGYFLTSLKNGAFKLGDVPAGAITADVRGCDKGKLRSFFSDGSGFSDGAGFANSISAAYTATTAGIIGRLIIDRGIGRNNQLETTSFGLTDRDQPATVGLWLPAGDQSTCLEVIDRLARGIGAYFGQDPDGRYELRRFEAPFADPWRTIDDTMLLSMVSADLPYRVPPASWQVPYARNWTLQNPEEISRDGATGGDYQFATRQWQMASSVDPVIRAAFKTMRVLQTDSYFVNAVDAQAEAQRLLGVYSLGRGAYTLTLPLSGLSYRRGQYVRLQTNHVPGFEAGKPMTIIDVDVSVGLREAAITVFG